MSKPLDEMYGEGTSKAFRAALEGKADIAEVWVGAYVRVNATWGRSELKIDCWPRRVHFLHLRSGKKNTYTELCEALPPLFKERGVQEFTASPGGPEEAEILMKRGEWRLGPGGLVWEI